VPAVARESIAAEPTCSQLSIRNSSPNPGSVFSSMPARVSYVVSRRETPVPPLTTTMRASPTSASTAARTSSGSSRTTR